MRYCTVCVVLGVLVLSGAVQAQERRVLRAPSRGFSLACSPMLGGQTFSFSEDEWFREARASLRDPAQFGPLGRVPIELVFGPPFDSFNPQELDGADILVLNPYSATPQGSELRVFGVYARGGVGFVSFQNAAATFFAGAGTCVGDNTATFATPTTVPALAGPFGTVASPYATGWNCSFAMPDPLAVVVSSNDAGPNGLAIDLSPRYPGAARAVSFGDEELFASLSVPGCGTTCLARGNNNDVLLRNVFAWVAATAHDPIPSSVEGTGDLDHDGIRDDLDGDTDNDGVLDLFEAGDTDPATPPVDTDGDGTPDYRDPDSDGDGLEDAVEAGATLLEAPVDTDLDGTPDLRETDADGDTIPDRTEGAADTDRDGTPDYRDTDSDGDGVSDDRDLCRTASDPLQTDGDHDTVGDPCDNCPSLANAGQEDADHDGTGDACEPVDAGPPPGDAGPVTDSGLTVDVPDHADVLPEARPAQDVAMDRPAADSGRATAPANTGCACGVLHVPGRGAAGVLLLLAALPCARRRKRRPGCETSSVARAAARGSVPAP